MPISPLFPASAAPAEREIHTGGKRSSFDPLQAERMLPMRRRSAELAAAPHGMFLCNVQGVLTEVNAAFEQLVGYQAYELIGQRTLASLLDPIETARRSLPDLARMTSRYEAEWTCLRRDNASVPVLLALAPFVEEAWAHDPQFAWSADAAPSDGRVLEACCIGIVIDMTRYADVRARLWYVAHHDSVTQLPNQTLFAERLELSVARSAITAARFSILLVELDELRQLRDALGVEMAEAVAQRIGERLRDVLPRDGMLAALSGAQFALLIPGDAGEALAPLVLEQIAEPLELGISVPVKVSARLGLAAYPADGLDAATLMRRAYVALSATARSGADSVQRFRAPLDKLAAQRFSLQTQLTEAVERQQFYLAYQPQVTLATGQVTQIEALLRWRHPERGSINPAEFVPLAEETGLIEPIGNWVIHSACREASRLLRLTGSLPTLAVNVSARQLRSPALLGVVKQALEDAALDPSYLEIEITESALMDDIEAASRALHALRELGVSVAIDDFGTGYSSLAYLTRFPVNRLKIDRAFVARMLHDPSSAALVSAIIAMGHALNLRVTAEGAESAAQVQRLSELGCDEVQGYWFARPMSLAALRNLLQPLGT